MWKSGVSALLGLAILGAAGNARGAEQNFTVVNIDYEGSKVFVPATLVVHQGDHVKIKVVNNIKADPNQHGFAIADYKIEKVVTRGEPQEVEFDATQAGIFPIKCQLHPAHVGGELVVLPAVNGKTAK
ncbi:MAG: cupredoxin domain-containing protein [Candidatus Binatia bacterium]|jgi:plastocyanin